MIPRKLYAQWQKNSSIFTLWLDDTYYIYKIVTIFERIFEECIKAFWYFLCNIYYIHTYVELLLYADSILCSPIFSVCLQSGRRLTFQQPTTISHKFHKIVHFDVQNIWIVSVFHPVVCTAVVVIFFDILSTVSQSRESRVIKYIHRRFSVCIIEKCFFYYNCQSRWCLWPNTSKQMYFCTG